MSSDSTFDDYDLASSLTSPFNYLSPALSLNRDSYNISSSTNNNINVICRFRPILNFELIKGNKSIVDFPNSQTVSLLGKDFTNHFVFDRIFEPETSQQDIYQFSISQTVDDLLNGYNGTVLTYGQTGSGKSYTMMGSSLHDDEERGIIPRISQDIFDHILNGSSDVEYTVGVNYYEIHMEQIKDLLDNSMFDSSPPTPNSSFTKNHPKYTIHQDKINGVYVKGLSQAFVSSSQELLQVLQRGLKNRTSSSTLMNSESSRSHAIFQIKLTQKHVTTDIIKRSQLFLVDLAGSEKVDKSGAIGQTLEEAKKINSSLSALGNVINALTDGKSTHIPYRDSKLTRILQESLGGNSRTSLIINCSPSSINEIETLSTLRFGTRAKSIKNTAHINTELSTANLKQKVTQLEKLNHQNQNYIKQLEQELHHWRNGDSQSIRSSVTLHTNNNSNNNNNISNIPFANPSSLHHNSSSLSLYSPSTSFQSRLPIPSAPATAAGAAASSSLNSPFKTNEEIERRDKKIIELEDKLLNLKMDKLRNSHTEESKLFTLENSLAKLNDKLVEVELVNVNLRKHLLISEKIIESRDVKINKLKSSLKEQQLLISKETLGFRHKLGDIQSKLDYLNQQKEEEISIIKRQSEMSLQHSDHPMFSEISRTNTNHSKNTINTINTINTVSSTNTLQSYPPLKKNSNKQSYQSINSNRTIQSSGSGDINDTAITSQSTYPNTTNETTVEHHHEKPHPHKHPPMVNLTQEYVSIGEFLAESRRRSKLIQTNILSDLESSDTSDMFGSGATSNNTDEVASVKSLGLNLKIIKPFRGGSTANSARSSKIESII